MNATTESAPVEPHYTEFLEYKASVALWRYFPPILIVLGTLGNIMSIVVLTRKSMRQSTVSVYLTVLAVTDILVLYTGLLRQWIRVITEIDIRDLNPIVCKVHTWIVYFTLDFSSWLLVAVTLERFFSVFFPHSVKRRCTKCIAGIIMSVVATLLLAINSHYLYGLGDVYYINSQNPTEMQSCSALWSEYAQFTATIWPWIDLCLFCLFPFLFLIAGNVAIIVKVCISNRKRRRHDAAVGLSNTQSMTVRSSRTSSMTVMLLTTNVMFLLCTSPISILLIGYDYWFDYSTMGNHQYAVSQLYWAAVNIIMYTNNAMNFLLYCLSGSRFREVLKSLFVRNRRVRPTTSFTRNNNTTMATTWPSGSRAAPETQMTDTQKQKVKFNVSVVGQEQITDHMEI